MVVVAAALAITGSGDDARPAADVVAAVLGGGSDDGDPPTTDTTLPLVPVTGGAPMPTTPPVASTVPGLTAAQIEAARPPGEPAATSATGEPLRNEPVLTGADAILVRPTSEDVRPVDKARGCRSANDKGWSVVDCGAVKRADGVLLWVVESKGRGLRMLLLREQTAGRWITILRAADDDGTRWKKIGVRAEDVSGDGAPDLVVGFHGRDAASTLGLDVVDGPTGVGLHVGLAAGGATAERGSLTGWARLADGSYDTSVFRVIGGNWRLASSGRLPAGQAPRSMV